MAATSWFIRSRPDIMTCIEKFTFSRSFPALPGSVAGREEAAPARPVHTDDDLARACEEARAAGRDEGYATGLADGRAEAETAAKSAREQHELDVLARIAAHLEQAVGERDAIAREAEQSALALALSGLRKALPDLHRRHALGEIEAMVRDLPDSLADGAADANALSLALEPELATALGPRLVSAAAGRGLADRLAVTADPGLAAGDCRITWKGGGAERRLATLITRITDIVETVAGETSAGETSAAADIDPFRSTPHHG